MYIHSIFLSWNIYDNSNISTEISPEHIINMDETPCYFDLPCQSTVHAKGEKTVGISTTGYEKMRFTAVLSCSSNGAKLPPMLIFKNLKNIPKLKTGTN